MGRLKKIVDFCDCQTAYNELRDEKLKQAFLSQLVRREDLTFLEMVWLFNKNKLQDREITRIINRKLIKLFPTNETKNIEDFEKILSGDKKPRASWPANVNTITKFFTWLRLNRRIIGRALEELSEDYDRDL